VQTLGFGEKITKSSGSQDIGEFMRVTNRGSGSEWQDTAFKMRWNHERTLDMDVGVDEAGNQPLAATIDLSDAFEAGI
jgi:hypothetical protein